MAYRTTPPANLRMTLLATSALVALAATLPVLTASDAAAAGFALKEQSAAAQGNAFAGATAGAEDVSYMFFNPAGLTRHQGQQAAVVLSYIMPQGETKNANGSVGGNPASGDAADDALVPAVYGMWSVNQDLKLALGINVPFGLTTKYDLGWAGRAYAIESSVESININPAVAYRINENLSVGFGLQAQRTDVTLSQQIPIGGPPAQDPLFEVKGDDWAYGFNLGVLFEPSPQTRFGVAYRGRIKQEISGTATFGPNATGANADLTTPDSATLGFYHDINEQWAVMGEVAWTGWSVFDQIVINMNTDIGLGTAAIVPEQWDDSWFAALGATWRPNESWTVRGGIAYDQTPLSDQFRSPRLTDEDRTWVSVGAKYQVSPAFSFDFGYTHIFIKDAHVNITLPPTPTLTADFENSVDIVTAQATLHF